MADPLATDPEGPAPGAQIVALTGVYHANGSLAGELAYLVGKLLGRRHCALCDITHGTLRERPEMAACRAALPVPLELVHLDERTPEVAVISEGRTPCVVAHLDDGRVEVLLGPEELEACGERPDRLAGSIEAAAARAGRSFAG